METKWLTYQEGKIAYDDEGEGPLVICIPSLGDMREEYRFIGPKLVKAGFRVIKMDLRGVGESSLGWDDYSLIGVGKDILALIHDLDASPAVVMGTSLAAGAGILAAVEDPSMVSSLILIGPAVHGETKG
jgi:pimeloyl-ACP methyl ester carboxylesterase